MPTSHEALRILVRAAEIVGGAEEFATRLGISAPVLRLYLDGREPAPDILILKAVDIVLDEVEKVLHPPTAQPRSEDSKKDR